MTAVVTAESLTKRFGEVSAVTDLSFALEAGMITGFLGPNGAGKTTTLRMILGLVAPTRGRALVFDHRYAALPRAALRIGAVLEATDFHPGRSGRDHLRMLGQAIDVPDSRADEVLRLVDLGDAAHRRVKGYLLGMRQRLGLAAALLGDPDPTRPERSAGRTPTTRAGAPTTRSPRRPGCTKSGPGPDVDLEGGWCLMTARPAYYLVAFAAEPFGDETRFAHAEACNVPGPKLLQHATLPFLVLARRWIAGHIGRDIDGLESALRASKGSTGPGRSL
jgi:ABC-type transport system involved in cytochrome c biogenesis ATPase subunit